MLKKAKIKVFNKEGKLIKSEELDLDDSFNNDLVHQVVGISLSRGRKSIANTKDRAMVRGGGKKPWKQKGTGRARHGSIRSPLWKGGGVTFGPTNQSNFNKRLPDKIRDKALLMIIRQKIHDGEVVVFESPDSQLKTKDVFAWFKKINPELKSAVLVLDNNRNLYLASRNIKNLKPINFNNINILDLVNHKYALIDERAFQKIKSKIT